MLSNSYKYYYYRGGGGAMGTVAAVDGGVYTSSPFSLTLRWTATQDVVNNQSTINYAIDAEAYAVNGTEYVKLGASGTFPLSLYQDKQSYSTSIDWIDTKGVQKVYVGTPVTIATGSFVIDHKSNGGKTIKLRVGSFPVQDAWQVVNGVEQTTVSWGTGASNYATCTIEGTEDVLDTIARHAVIYSAPDFTDEDTVPINYAVPSGITGYIYLSLDGAEGTESTALKAVTGAGTYNYSFSATDQKKLWTIQDQGLTTKRVRFYIKSTSSIDGVTYREPSNWINLNIINYTPTLNTEVWDSNTDAVNRLTGDKYKLIRYVSNASYTTGGVARKGATIQTQVTYNNGVSKHGASGVFEKIPGNDTSTEFDFTITDNYGRSLQETMQFSTTVGNYIPYVKLTCGVEVTEMTADGDVQIKITGKCFNGSFGKKTNRLRVFYNIAKNNADDFDHVDLGYAEYASNYGNSFSITGNDYLYTLNISGLEYLSVYDFTVWVADEVATEGVPAETVLAARPIFDWGRTDFNFNVAVTMQDNLEVAGTLKVGNVSQPTIVAQSMSDTGWSYRKWSDGWAECWRNLSVTSAVSTGTNASWYSSGELSTTNLSYPFTFAARPTLTVQTMPTGTSYCIVFPSNTAGTAAKTGSFQLMSMTSLTSRAHLLTYIVKGRWK